MAAQYSMAADGPEEEMQLMNEEEPKNLSSSRLNRTSLVIFFGVAVVAAAIVIGTVMITLYSGKR